MVGFGNAACIRRGLMLAAILAVTAPGFHQKDYWLNGCISAYGARPAA
jgi:hypothetical protein